METKIAKKQLIALSIEELMDKTKNRAVNVYLYDGRFTQLCANDLQGFDDESSMFYARTGIKIYLQDLDYIEVSKKCSV